MFVIIKHDLTFRILKFSKFYYIAFVTPISWTGVASAMH